MPSGKPKPILSKPLRQHLQKLKETLTLRLANKLLTRQGFKPLKKLHPPASLGLSGLGPSSVTSTPPSQPSDQPQEGPSPEEPQEE